MHPLGSIERLLGRYFQITLQRLHIFLKGFQACGRDAAERAGFLALESLFHLDVACRREYVYLHTQIARRGARLFLDVGELGFLGTDKQRHHGQSQLGMQQGAEKSSDACDKSAHLNDAISPKYI